MTNQMIGQLDNASDVRSSVSGICAYFGQQFEALKHFAVYYY